MGHRVLDVGCGTGVFLRAAADRGAEVFGLDASEALLEIARTRVLEADLRIGDMQFLPYEDDAFDVVAGLRPGANRRRGRLDAGGRFRHLMGVRLHRALTRGLLSAGGITQELTTSDGDAAAALV